MVCEYPTSNVLLVKRKKKKKWKIPPEWREAWEEVGREFLASNVRGDCPANSVLIVDFRLISDAEIFVNKHRPSIRIERQTCKKRVCDVYVFRLSFRILHITVGGWVVVYSI